MHSLELTQWDQRRMPQEVEMSRELQQLMEKTRIAQKRHQMNANEIQLGSLIWHKISQQVERQQHSLPSTTTARPKSRTRNQSSNTKMSSEASATTHMDLELDASKLNDALKKVKTSNNNSNHLLKYCEADKEGFCQGFVELSKNG